MHKTTGKLVFGPVPSRRLGRSLGIDVLPLKTCNLNCIYCELGPTRSFTTSSVAPFSVKAIKNAFERYLERGKAPFDVVTITASGEPTLHKEIRGIVSAIKAMTDRPVAVLTNATLIGQEEVAEALCMTDMVLPSLDAGTETTFRKINRPCQGITLEQVVKGLEAFRRSYPGKILLETLFVRGINDSDTEVEAILRHVRRIRPDEVQINTVARPPAESWAEPVGAARLEAIREMLGPEARIITSFKRPRDEARKGPGEEELLEILKRRPLSREDIHDLFDQREDKVMALLMLLTERGLVQKKRLRGKDFYLKRER